MPLTTVAISETTGGQEKRLNTNRSLPSERFDSRDTTSPSISVGSTFSFTHVLPHERASAYVTYDEGQCRVGPRGECPVRESNSTEGTQNRSVVMQIRRKPFEERCRNKVQSKEVQGGHLTVVAFDGIRFQFRAQELTLIVRLEFPISLVRGGTWTTWSKVAVRLLAEHVHELFGMDDQAKHRLCT
ncbi:hypothetical protein BD410DRAFT_806356 [Rickenella mellea]|uniref:Uncharacterized protein n=1 Tax=Rickenella mellea TaxID=50990 RepID=A0A4Y7PUS7_9AGAM|nr:hypothetical protein BD410DRAFT_806356 [Rickenella mellea]